MLSREGAATKEDPAGNDSIAEVVELALLGELRPDFDCGVCMCRCS